MRCGSLSILVVAAGTLTACSLIYGPSQGEFTNGAYPDDSSADASGDVGTGDAAKAPSGDDGGSSSGASSGTSSGDAEAGAPFGCAPGALVCDDFEGATPSSVLSTVGTSKIVPGGHASGHSLFSNFSKGKTSYLSANFQGKSKASLSFWIRTDGPPPTNEVYFRIAHLLFGDACDWPLSWQVYFAADGLHQGADSYNAQVNPSCGPVKHTDKPLLTAAEMFDKNWHHVVLVADATGQTRVTSTIVDDHSPVTESIDSGRSITPTTIDFAVGIPCVQSGGGCFEWMGPDFGVYFDQVELTLPSP